MAETSAPAICESLWTLFETLKPPEDTSPINPTSLAKILAYANPKTLIEHSTYYQLICPRSNDPAHPCTHHPEVTPSFIIYKDSGWGVDFHHNPHDPQYHVSPFETWCLLKYGQMDKSKYGEFCDDVGIPNPDLPSAIDLIYAWAMPHYEPLCRTNPDEPRQTFYSRKFPKWVSVSQFRGESDKEIQDKLRREARECQPPAAKKPYKEDQMAVFFKTWAEPVFYRIYNELPMEEDIEPDQLPAYKKAQFIGKLRELLNRLVNFNFGKERGISSLWERAKELEVDPHQWHQLEAYAAYFKRVTREQMLIAVRFDLLEQMDRSWAQQFRSKSQFTRAATKLKVGADQEISVNNCKVRVVVIDAATIGLELTPPTGMQEQVEQATEPERGWEV